MPLTIIISQAESWAAPLPQLCCLTPMGLLLEKGFYNPQIMACSFDNTILLLPFCLFVCFPHLANSSLEIKPPILSAKMFSVPMPSAAVLEEMQQPAPAEPPSRPSDPRKSNAPVKSLMLLGKQPFLLKIHL